MLSVKSGIRFKDWRVFGYTIGNRTLHSLFAALWKVYCQKSKANGANPNRKLDKCGGPAQMMNESRDLLPTPVMIAQWNSSLSVLPVARVRFPATAEYFKGFFPG